MQLTNISYHQFPNDNRHWVLTSLDLQKINLIVGKNSSGKTRALNIINGLAAHISGRNQQLPVSMNYVAHFEDGGIKWTYELSVAEKSVEFEKLTRGTDVLLERGNNGEGTIFSEEQQKMLKFQSPQSVVAVFSRQDTLQHSYLSKLIEWANGTFHYPFGRDFGQGFLAAQLPTAPPPNLYDANQTTGIFMKGKKEFGSQYQDAIVADMRSIGYSVTAVGVMTPTTVEFTSSLPLTINCLFVQEDNLKSPTEQIDLSQGMFRALSIFIHLNYGLLSGSFGCILIDDIGEGLDFERSNAVIKAIVSKIEGTNHQLLMTTNDRFVMNSVPLKYWSILDRRGPEVHVFNETNAGKKFEDFKFTGLSNFDFLATDFIHSADIN